MPKTGRPQSYRLHKARDCAVVTIDGRNHYLGRYGSPDSLQKYLDHFSKWVSSKFGAVPFVTKPENESGLTINELMLGYWEHSQSYYVKNGKPTDEQACIRAAPRPLRRLFGHLTVDKIGPCDLEAVRMLTAFQIGGTGRPKMAALGCGRFPKLQRLCRGRDHIIGSRPASSEWLAWQLCITPISTSSPVS